MKVKNMPSVAYRHTVVRNLWVGGLALVLGAVAFLSLWISAPTTISDSLPRPVSLAVHGTSILLLSIGLIFVAKDLNKQKNTSYWVTITGVIVAIVGLFTVFSLIPLGFGVFAAGLVLAKRDRMSSIITIAGSIALLVTIILGARVGMDDAPELSNRLRIAFQIAVFLMATGLIVIGSGEIRRNYKRAK